MPSFAGHRGPPVESSTACDAASTRRRYAPPTSSNIVLGRRGRPARDGKEVRGESDIGLESPIHRVEISKCQGTMDLAPAQPSQNPYAHPLAIANVKPVSTDRFCSMERTFKKSLQRPNCLVQPSRRFDPSLPSSVA